MNPVFFPTQAAFRKWLQKNHRKKPELLVGYYKTKAGKGGLTHAQAVDEALCFGWIDGRVQSLDGESYCVRFTPRRTNSIWSAKNIKRVSELSALGLMHPEGIEAFENRSEKRMNLYSFEQKHVAFPDKYLKKFKSNRKAWQNFQNMPPSYQRPATWWVISAKQEETQLRRLSILIADSEKRERVNHLKVRKGKT